MKMCPYPAFVRAVNRLSAFLPRNSPFARGSSARLAIAVFALLLALTATSLEARNDWDPIDPAEWNQTRSQIDPEAHSEIIFKRIRLGNPDREVYFRVRIYDEKGVEEFAKIELEHRSGGRVHKVEARTIKPDGTIIELDEDDVFVRETVKTRGVRVMTTSFAPPGLEPGVIIEYRFERIGGGAGYINLLQFQESRPVRHCEYEVRLPPVGGVVKTLFLNRPKEEVKPDRGNRYRYVMTDLPALPEEPYTPDFEGIGATVLLYLSYGTNMKPDQYWREVSSDLAKETRAILRTSKRTLRKELETILDGSEDTEAKLRKLHDFCRSQLINLDRDSPEAVAANADDPPKIDSVKDVLKHRMGDDHWINRTFIALAAEAGFDVRLATVGDRESFPVSRNITERFFLFREVAAIKMAHGWILTDPGATYLPLSMLAPENSFALTCIGDSKQEVTETSPGSAARHSLRRRVARFELKENGDLEGTVEEHLQGYWALSWRKNREKDSAEEDRDSKQEWLRESLANAEVSDFDVAHKYDVLEPLVIRYRLTVPGFADRTGSRLFFSPAVFNRGQDPVFEAEKRTTRILFPYLWSELDDITIVYPEGFKLEEPSAPDRVDFGRIGTYENRLTVQPDSREVRLRRGWSLNEMVHGTERYDFIKGLFEARQASDNHTLTLRRLRD